MPTATYEQLLADTLPACIESDEQYQETGERLAELIRQGASRSRDETRLMRLLALLIGDYDRRHGMPADDSTPAEKLQFLMEHSGKSPVDLLPVFGQRSHVNEALNGKRGISADHARKLGQLFSVNPGLFV